MTCLPSKFLCPSSSFALIPFFKRAGNKYFNPSQSIRTFDDETDSGKVKLIIFNANGEEKFASLFKSVYFQTK